MPVKAFRNVKELKEAWNDINERLKLHAGHLKASELLPKLRKDIDDVCTATKKSVFIL